MGWNKLRSICYKFCPNLRSFCVRKCTIWHFALPCAFPPSIRRISFRDVDAVVAGSADLQKLYTLRIDAATIEVDGNGERQELQLQQYFLDSHYQVTPLEEAALRDALPQIPFGKRCVFHSPYVSLRRFCRLPWNFVDNSKVEACAKLFFPEDFVRLQTYFWMWNQWWTVIIFAGRKKYSMPPSIGHLLTSAHWKSPLRPCYIILSLANQCCTECVQEGILLDKPVLFLVIQQSREISAMLWIKVLLYNWIVSDVEFPCFYSSAERFWRPSLPLMGHGPSVRHGTYICVVTGDEQ